MSCGPGDTNTPAMSKNAAPRPAIPPGRGFSRDRFSAPGSGSCTATARARLSCLVRAHARYLPASPASTALSRLFPPPASTARGWQDGRGTDLDHAAVLDALETGYQNVTDVVTGLSEADLMRPSGCAGWAVTDVLYHQLLDAQRALVAFATPVTGPADRDDVSYWAAFAPKGGAAGGRARAGAAAHARFVRVAASAYSPGSLARTWSETAASACRAARACPAAAVATQGYVLGLADFTATLAVETAVHYLDLTVSLPSAPPPDPASL